MKKAVLIVESQPPHLGEYVLLLKAVQDYEFVYVCINSPPLVMPIEHSIAIWEHVTSQYGRQVKVVYVKDDFAEMPPNCLPEEFKDKVLITTSQKIFTHLSSMNLPIELVPNLAGYHGVFLRVAYRQGRALDWLRTKGVNSISNNKAKEE